jgi:hypothetical protein
MLLHIPAALLDAFGCEPSAAQQSLQSLSGPRRGSLAGFAVSAVRRHHLVFAQCCGMLMLLNQYIQLGTQQGLGGSGSGTHWTLSPGCAVASLGLSVQSAVLCELDVYGCEPSMILATFSVAPVLRRHPTVFCNPSVAGLC